MTKKARRILRKPSGLQRRALAYTADTALAPRCDHRGVTFQPAGPCCGARHAAGGGPAQHPMPPRPAAAPGCPGWRCRRPAVSGARNHGIPPRNPRAADQLLHEADASDQLTACAPRLRRGQGPARQPASFKLGDRVCKFHGIILSLGIDNLPVCFRPLPHRTRIILPGA